MDLDTNLPQYLQNIALFVPLGLLLPLLWKNFQFLRVTLFTGFLFSVAIELIQLLSHQATDIDDLLMSTLGTMLGYGIWLVVKKNFQYLSPCC